MDNIFEKYLDVDFESIPKEEQDLLIESIGNRIEDKDEMLRLANLIPFNTRRGTMCWTSVLDEDNKPIGSKVTTLISNLTTKHIKNILKWTDYDLFSNDSLVLHTIKEELNYRNKL